MSAPVRLPPPRKTRIIATVGPSSESFERLRELAEAGVNVFRLNFSHAKHDWARGVVTRIRELEQHLGRPIAILMDTQGPSIRTGELPVPLTLVKGGIFTFTVGAEKPDDGPGVGVNYDKLDDDLSVGDTVLVDNGVIRMKVLEKKRDRIRCEVLTPGIMGSRRHINLPGVKVSLPSITEKDFVDVRWGAENGLDFVALSFVRTRADIEQLREFLTSLRSPMRILAKIEDQEAVRNFDEILHAADAVMVARGDLGVELPFEELPILQRRIVRSCLRFNKPVIVATQMLESMIENPMPTRAEVTDVANAAYEQADAVMLSGETSVGRHPVKCVEALDAITRRMEREEGASFTSEAVFTNDRQRLVASAIMLANELKAVGVVVFTHAGNMPRMASWLRPQSSHIYAFTPNETIWRQMCLLWGVRAFQMDLKDEDPEVSVQSAIKVLKKENLVQPGDTLVFLTQVRMHNQAHDSVQPRKVT